MKSQHLVQPAAVAPIPFLSDNQETCWKASYKFPSDAWQSQCFLSKTPSGQDLDVFQSIYTWSPSSSPKNLRRKPMKENAAAAAWCWSVGSSEHSRSLWSQSAVTIWLKHRPLKLLGFKSSDFDYESLHVPVKNGEFSRSHHWDTQLIVQSQRGSGCAAAPPGLVSPHCNFVWCYRDHGLSPLSISSQE